MKLDVKEECSTKKCPYKASALIRTKPVCERCFRLYQMDNKKRHDRKIKIPESLRLMNVRR